MADERPWAPATLAVGRVLGPAALAKGRAPRPAFNTLRKPCGARTLLRVEAVPEQRQQLQLLDADAQLADLALQLRLLPGPPLLRRRRRRRRGAEEAQRLVGDGRQPRGPAGSRGGHRGLPGPAGGRQQLPRVAAFRRGSTGFGAVVEGGEEEGPRRGLLAHGAARLRPPTAVGPEAAALQGPSASGLPGGF